MVRASLEMTASEDHGRLENKKVGLVLSLHCYGKDKVVLRTNFYSARFKPYRRADLKIQSPRFGTCSVEANCSLSSHGSFSEQHWSCSNYYAYGVWACLDRQLGVAESAQCHP
jgi:hypothetical protein